MAGALDGITVLDFGRGHAAALATMFLSDHGARVIRVLGPEDPVLRDGGFRVWDRGKELLRLEQPGYSRDLADWIAAVDVLIEDHAPGERPDWLSRAHLRAQHPRLVACSITGYGEHGPLRDAPPIDDLVLSRTGVLGGLPGFRRRAPIHCVHPLPSTGAGVLAALGVAAALFDRERDGRGRHVATSLVAGALLYHPKVLGEHLAPTSFQTNPYGSAPFYSVYRCADDAWIQLGCVHPGFIARAAALFGIAELLEDPIYGRGHAPETDEADAHLRAALTTVLATRTADAWAATFEAEDIPHARVRETSEALDDPQVRHNGLVVSLDDPELGPLEQLGVPVKLSVTPGCARGPRAAAAEHIEPPQHQVASVSEGRGGSPADSEGPRPGPLAGIRVLEITNLIAGPTTGRLLADLGADVCKLEPPAGDISRPIGRTYFYSVNYGKRAIVIDTSQDLGKEVVQRLARDFDVVLANLRPGATARMGIGLEADPNVIETQISGYGLDGPYAHRPGMDPLAQALMGLERAQAGADNPPTFPAQLAPTDFTAGAMAAFGTALALFARVRGTARGQQVAVNLLDAGAVLSAERFARSTVNPMPGSRSQNSPLADAGQHGRSPWHRLYATGDGYIYVAADDAAARAGLLRAIGVDSQEALAQAFTGLSSEVALQRLAAAGVPAAPVAAPESDVFFGDPQTAANGWSATRPHATAGALTAVCNYIHVDDPQAATIRPTPLLGEHSQEILQEAGLAPEEISGRYRDVLPTVSGS